MGNSRFLNINNDTIAEVCQMVAKTGNRSERRKVLRALNKTSKITEYAHRQVTDDARKELNERSKDSFGYIMSMFGIVLHDKFGWSDEKIAEMFTEVSNRLDGEWAEGKSVEDVARELFEKTGIELVVK